MLIAGSQKLSLVDYPGHLAAVIFTAGCNFRCGYCHNPGLVLFDGRGAIAKEELLSELSRRRNMIEGVVISGGEPTLAPDLPEFAESLKEMGFLVKLDTNGSDPDMVFRMLRDRVIDYVAMDVKTSLSRYEEVTGVKGIAPLIEESIRWIMLSCVPYEFRTTCVPGLTDETEIASISELIRGANKYCLQQFSRNNAILDDKFSDVIPFSPDKIKSLAAIAKDKVSSVETRGI